MTRWPDQLDFSAELSKARAAKPDAIYVFYPGGTGRAVHHPVCAIRSQRTDSALHRVHHRELSLPRLKDLAVGVGGERLRPD